jgi:flagellar motor switch protein FliG
MALATVAPNKRAAPAANGAAPGEDPTRAMAVPVRTSVEVLAEYNGVQRVAALLIALGPDASTAVFKHLREDDVEAITLEIFGMRHVPAKVTDAVIEDVYETLVASDYMETGGLQYAQDLITRTFGAERAQELINRISARIRKAPFDFLRDIDPSQLISFLQPEHPQTVALVLSHLRPEQAAAILTGLHPEVQSDVARRIAMMDRTAPEVIKDVDRLLKDKLSSLGAQSTQLVGGVKHLVDVLNAADTTSQKSIVDTLDEQQPELAEEIKKNMFIFEDLINLSDRDVQRLCRELETRDLALALRGASDALQEKIITKGMSSRAGAQLRDDMELMGPQRVANIEEAQQKVIAVVRRLEQAEEITISRGGRDEFR